MTTEYETTFQGLPADPQKRKTIKEYLNEAIKHKKAQDAAKLLEAEVYDAIKEGEDHLEITPKYFKQLVAFAYDEEKKEKALGELEAAKEGLELLGIIEVADDSEFDGVNYSSEFDA